MVPSGKPTDQTIDELPRRFGRGDIIIDGGNTNWKEGLACVQTLQGQRRSLVDAGTSGGVWGLKEGYCLMVGGDDDAVAACEPIFHTLAPEAATRTSGPRAPDIFQRWFITASSTACLPHTARVLKFSKSRRSHSTWHNWRELWRTAASSVRGCSISPCSRSKRIPGLTDIRATSTTRARAAGPCRPRSKKAYRRR